VNLPFYRSLRDNHRDAQSTPNPALIFDRFVEWGDDWTAAGAHKQRVLKEVADHAADRRLLEAYLGRQERLVKTLGGVPLEAETTGRFVSGLGGAHPFETGFVWHSTLGVPYLPGSSVKGAMRTWAQQWLETEDEARHLFGGGDGAGALIVPDALPTRPPRLELDVMTPHYGGYYMGDEPPADYLSPNPVVFLTVAAGQAFRFYLLPRERKNENNDGWLERGARLLKEALETVGAGAKTSAGYGSFAVKEPKKDLRFEQMKARIEVQNPAAIGAVPGLVDELANLPAGERRRKLAEFLYNKFLSDHKRRRIMWNISVSINTYYMLNLSIVDRH